MTENSIKNLQFSINNWSHLYSLQQAIQHNDQLTGNKLSLTGSISSTSFLNNINTPVTIDFIQSDSTPAYPAIKTGLNELGIMALENKALKTCITVDRKIFEELRKNLMEYADIEGIHIVVTIGLLCNANVWEENNFLPIVQLDYAMKGDA